MVVTRPWVSSLNCCDNIATIKTHRTPKCCFLSKKNQHRVGVSRIHFWWNMVNSSKTMSHSWWSWPVWKRQTSCFCCSCTTECWWLNCILSIDNRNNKYSQIHTEWFIINSCSLLCGLIWIHKPMCLGSTENVLKNQTTSVISFKHSVLNETNPIPRQEVGMTLVRTLNNTHKNHVWYYSPTSTIRKHPNVCKYTSPMDPMGHEVVSLDGRFFMVSIMVEKTSLGQQLLLLYSPFCPSPS